MKPIERLKLQKAEVDTAIYTPGEASRFLRLPKSTVYAWTTKTPAIVRPANPRLRLLSFSNLIELHILASIRTVHGVSHQAVKRSLDFLRDRMGVERPLLEAEMMTDGKNLFVERMGNLVNISKNGQHQIRELMEAHLRRIEWSAGGIGTRLYPFTRPGSTEGPLVVAISPGVRSGRPCIKNTRIATEIVAGRYFAGDSTSFLAEDYGCDVEEIEEAIRYESRTAA
jgi:uncharacterized protein (DUF433 family)